MSDTNRLRISYAEESTWGVSPGGTLIDVRATGESLALETNTQVSDEIRSDRQIADVFRTSVRAAGSLNFEMSGASFDDMMRAALFSAAWSTQVLTSSNTRYAATGSNTITDTTAAFISDGYAVGQWIKMAGWTNAANNGYFKITAVATGTHTLAGFTATVVEAASAFVTITMGPQILNGITETSFTVEKHYLDLTNEYELFTGMVIDQFDLNIAAEEAITGTANFLGQDSVSASSTTGAGYTLPNANPVLQAVDHVPSLLEGTVAGGTVAITELSLSLSNNLRARQQVGSLGPISLGTGSVEVSGTLRAFFNTATLMDKYLNFTTSALAVLLSDPATPYFYVVELPQVKYTSGTRVAGGKDQDVLADLSFNAFRDPTDDATMRITRWTA